MINKTLSFTVLWVEFPQVQYIDLSAIGSHKIESIGYILETIDVRYYQNGHVVKAVIILISVHLILSTLFGVSHVLRG